MSHLNAPAYFWLASVLTTYGDKLGPASMATISDRIAALEAGAGGVVDVATVKEVVAKYVGRTSRIYLYIANDLFRAQVAAAPKASEPSVDRILSERFADYLDTPQADPAPSVVGEDDDETANAIFGTMHTYFESMGIVALDIQSDRQLEALARYIATAVDANRARMVAAKDAEIARLTVRAETAERVCAALRGNVAALSDRIARDGLAAQEGAG